SRSTALGPGDGRRGAQGSAPGTHGRSGSTGHGSIVPCEVVEVAEPGGRVAAVGRRRTARARRGTERGPAAWTTGPLLTASPAEVLSDDAGRRSRRRSVRRRRAPPRCAAAGCTC